MSERWEPIIGYEGLYEVSDMGRVRSLDRVSTNGSQRAGRALTPTGAEHLHVTLSLGGKKVQPLVHRLVLESFVGPCPAGKIGLHWDDNPKNNKLSNLRWGTYASNMSDSYRNGIRPPAGALDEPSVSDIRARASRGETQTSIAQDHGVHQSTISLIAGRRTWKHVA